MFLSFFYYGTQTKSIPFTLFTLPQLHFFLPYFKFLPRSCRSVVAGSMLRLVVAIGTNDFNMLRHMALSLVRGLLSMQTLDAFLYNHS